MAETRANDSNEFGNDAARPVLDRQYWITDTCTEVGVGYTAKRRWV
jgi:transposase-like protein